MFTARYELNLYTDLRLILVFNNVPWLSRLVAGLLPRRSDFDPSSVHTRFVVDRVALGQVVLGILWFSLVSTISLIFHARFHLYVALSRRTNGPSLRTFEKVFSFSWSSKRQSDNSFSVGQLIILLSGNS